MPPRGVPRPFHQRMIRFIYSLSVGIYAVTGAFVFASNFYIASIIGFTAAVFMAVQEIPNFHTKVAGSIGWTQYIVVLIILPITPVIFFFIKKLCLIFKNKL